MALLLIMGVSHTHTDPTKDQRGCYKRGDIVEVLDDAKHDGDLAKNPVQSPWYLVRITGVTKAQVLKYLAPAYLNDDPATRQVVRRRKFQITADTLPLAVRQALQANRYVEVTAAQVQNYLVNKLTGLPE